MAEEIDTTELQKIVIGRVEPYIYSFITNTLPNYLKVGDTYRPVEERLNEWRKYYNDLEEVSRHPATVKNEVFFRDYSVHKYLTQKGFIQVEPSKVKKVYSREFFEGANGKDVSEAVADIVQKYKREDVYEYYHNENDRYEYHFARTQSFSPRNNQQAVIGAFKKAVKAGRTNLLMYAVMRFGKSVTSLWSAKSIDSKLTVIVSAKVDVKSEWKYAVESHVDFKGYRFLDKTDIKKISNLNSLYGESFKTAQGEEVCTNLVVFLTLQDLAGSAKELKKHHQVLKRSQVDLLIIDETHFGARAEVLGKILAGIAITEEQKKLLKQTSEDEEKMGHLEKLEAINAKVKLHLSGTPYRILMGDEFQKEDIVAFVQFSDIYEAKLKWALENLDKNEWENPYYGFPQMIRFAFNPNEKSRKKLSEIPGGKPADLFRPFSINKVNGYRKFVHEAEVIDLLKVLDGTKADSQLLGLLDNESIKKGSLAQHIVVVLPFRASCDAFERLMKQQKNSFKNLKEYKIFNLSGYDASLTKIEEIKSALAAAAKNKQKTITLTVNKMLTGSTVPQWDTMFYFKATASPQEYDQAIFRLQSSWVEQYRDKSGEVIKYDMKPQTLLVDLDPTRLFYLQERKAYVFGVNSHNVGNENIVKNIARELKVSPIIALNAEGKKLVEVTPTNIIDEVRQYVSERTILDDVRDIKIDLKLKDNEEIYKFISRLSALGDKNGLTIRPNLEDGEEFEDNNETDGSDETQTKQNSGENGQEISDDISAFEKRFRTYYVMILLFAFLSSTEEKSLTDVINSLHKNKDNRRIAANLGLKKRDLQLIRTHINPLVLSSLDYKIQNIDYRASDDSLSPTEHIEIAINKFGRLSESEVFTPSHVVSRMYESFDEQFWNNPKNTKVLDVASKSGVFAKGFVDKALENGAKLEDIKNSFYSIPTSPAAYEFTRKTYSALGLNPDNIAVNFNSYDLIKLNGIDLKKLLSQKKKFSEIKLSDLKKTARMNNKKISNMKFTAVVGNPPYHIDSGARQKTHIWHHFVSSSNVIGDNVSLIHPAGWVKGGIRLNVAKSKWKEDRNLKKITLFEMDIFPDVSTGPTTITVFDNSGKKYSNPELIVFKKDGSSLVTKYDYNHNKFYKSNEDERIEKIISKFKPAHERESLASLVSPQRVLGIEGKHFKKTVAEFSIDETDKLKTKVLVNEKLLDSNSKTDFYYIDSSNPEWEIRPTFVKKWKVALLATGKSQGKNSYVLRPDELGTDKYLFVFFDTRKEAENYKKYLETNFYSFAMRPLLVDQNALRKTHRNVPIQDFTNKSDIDWSQSVSNIDKQLYKKYSLNKEEVKFIESYVKQKK